MNSATKSPHETAQVTHETAQVTHETAQVTHETVLGLDFGLKRIGVALGNTLTREARALVTVESETSDVRFVAIGKLIAEWGANRLIVGLPLSPEGEETEISRRARRFARQLEGRFALPVALVQEQYSSTEAQSRVRVGQRDKARVDAEAAAVILQAYFDEVKL
jgi:putative holliday junction resolvase